MSTDVPQLYGETAPQFLSVMPPAPPVAPPRDMGDIAATRKAIFDRVIESAQEILEISNSRYTLKLGDFKYLDEEHYTKKKHKEALLRGTSLSRRLSGTWTLTDKATGKQLAKRRGVIAHVPYMTDLGTFARAGNDYVLSHQLRLRPGVYTRWQDNGQLEAHVNVAGGAGHKVFLDPETGIFKLRFGQASIPAVDVLETLGATPEQLQEAWGKDLYKMNAQHRDPRALSKLYQKLSYNRGTSEDDEERKQAVRDAFAKMKLDPNVSNAVLGKPYSTVNANVLLDTTAKLLRINRGQQDTDSRDDMAFQQLYGPEDVIAERMKNAPKVLRPLLWKLSKTGTLDKVPAGVFDNLIESAIIGSGLGQPIEEVNPLEIYDNQFRVTRMGEGGIASLDAVPSSARDVHISQLGFMDLMRTPESLKAGVDGRMASGARKGRSGNIYTQVKDRSGNIVWKSAQELAQSVVALPGELKTDKQFVGVVRGGKLLMLPREKVEYEVPTMQQATHAIGNMVPMMSGVKAQRAIMASRMLTQAVPLVNREAPLVQSGVPGETDKSYEDIYGVHAGAVRAETSGEVLEVTPDHIVLSTPEGKKEIELYRHFAFNRKTGLNQKPAVKPGDKINAGDLLATSNYTDSNGTTAVGLNARVAFLPFQGKTFEDGFVVSESFAKRAASIQYYKNKLDQAPGLTMGLQNFMAAKPGTYTKEQIANFDKNGLIKPGTVVNTGDPLLLATERVEPTAAQLKAGRKATYRDASLTWEHHDPGIVTDVFSDGKGAQVVVKSVQELQVADKLSNRYGSKGVIAAIVPDALLPTLPDGSKPEICMSPLSVVSRVNPAQVVELVLGKLARKTGKAYKMIDFDSIDDLTEFAQAEAKKYGVKDVEDMIDDTDPDHPKLIPSVLNGTAFFMKLHHSAESKAQSRGFGSYTTDGQPAKGGDEGAKRVGMLELNALLSHGATQNIADIKYVKGQENLDYWRQFMNGGAPPVPRVPFVYDKFVNLLKGAGINVVKQNSAINIMALTAKDVDTLAESRELTGIRDARTGLQTLPTVAWGANLQPINGGLFDPKMTGGHAGTQWSFIRMDTKLLNPVMETPLRAMLGLTEKDFRDVLSGEKDLGGKTGSEALYQAAKNLNLETEIARARHDAKFGKRTVRDTAIKKLNYLKSAERLGQHPSDWFMDKVPVLPPFYRPVSVMGGNKMPLVADSNYLYKQLFDVNQAYKATKPVFGESGKLTVGLYDAFKAVTGLGDPTTTELKQKDVKGLLKTVFGSGPKYSMIQRQLLGVPTDLSGRAVIALNPDYDMDTVGLPENLAWDAYRPFVIRNLRKHGRTGMQAIEEWKNQTRGAREALQQEMEARPVLLNRAPTLHKYGFMAMMPKLIKGDAIKINPFICSGMGADFDGDANLSYVFVRTYNKGIREIKPVCLTQEDEPAMFGSVGGNNTHTKESDMSYTHGQQIGIRGESTTQIVHLADFPHGDFIKSSNGQWGTIDWYEVPEEVEVLGYNESTGECEWSHPTVFSVHKGCPVVTVTTNSGRQIFTDDDPRAIYGMNPETFTLERATPVNAEKKHFVIPRMRYLPEITTQEIVGGCDTTTLAEKSQLVGYIAYTFEVGYLLGAFIGDGWTTPSANQMSLADADGHVSAYVSECIDLLATAYTVNEGRVNMSAYAMGRSARHYWSFNALGEWIDFQVGKGCRTKHLPPMFLHSSEEFRKGLFAGLMDTDGGVGISNGKKKPQLLANYTTTNLRLAQEIVLLASSLKIRASITTSKTPAGLPCWYVVFSSIDIKQWGGEGLQTPEKLRKIQETEVAANAPVAARNDLVPLSYSLNAHLRQLLGAKKKPTTDEDIERKRNYSALSTNKAMGYISRCSANAVLACLAKYNLKPEHEHFAAWKALIENESITWDYIAKVETTTMVETGYDLTVPGMDTFVDFQGIVLSNTMVFHVPTTDAACKEAVERLLPSRNLISARDFAVQPGISKDNLIGLYEGTRERPAGRVREFASEADVVKAYRMGMLSPQDTVRILK